jgi:peptidoglycan-N-acetylglucosamine deacetylase
MSNKPMRLKPKGLLSGAPEVKRVEKRTGFLQKAAAAAGKLFRDIGKALRSQTAGQLALCLCLAAVSVLYAGGLKDESVTVLSHKRQLPVYSVARQDKVVSISFDAAWGGTQTIPILDILDKYNVKTTFFLVGFWVDKYPELVKEIAARGHEIGNHSQSHPHMSQLSEANIKEELRIMSDKVERITGVRPTLFRPPYGDYSDKVVLISRAEGYEVIQWSIDSLDWKNRGASDINKQCTASVQNGDIVLFHNDAQYILQALPTVIEHYQKLGYTIIPISQILLGGETVIDVQGKQHPIPSPTPAPAR